jgi:hypothetical protein
VADHPVKVPPELFTEWLSEALLQHDAKSGTIAAMVADKAAQWGADQELEACVEQVDEAGYPSLAAHIRASRRPKPPSLAEQGIEALQRGKFPRVEHVQTLRAALKRLAELEAKQ